jgi:hypothetical protein
LTMGLPNVCSMRSFATSPLPAVPVTLADLPFLSPQTRFSETSNQKRGLGTRFSETERRSCLNESGLWHVSPVHADHIH